MKLAQGNHARRRNLDAIRQRDWARDYDTGVEPVLPAWLLPDAPQDDPGRDAIERRDLEPVYSA